MRKTGDISFELTAADKARGIFGKAEKILDGWITWKGVVDWSAERDNMLLQDGRLATVTRAHDSWNDAERIKVRLTEPIGEQLFETLVTVAIAGPDLGVACELRVGSAAPGANVRFDAFVPRAVKEILGLDDSWSVAGTPVSTRPAIFFGVSGGDDLAEVLWHPERTVPVVVVSEYGDPFLGSSIHAGLASDLAGVALVAAADSDACWQLSGLRGAEWSCYNGAVRLYYPRLGEAAEGWRNPLWTRRQLAQDGNDPSERGKRLKRLLRRLVLGHSAYSTYQPAAVLRAENLSTARSRVPSAPPAQDGADYDALEKMYAQENDRLRARLEELQAEVGDLRLQLANLQSALAFAEHAEAGDPVPVENFVTPSTVREAVDRARQEFADDLRFGADVDDGIGDLAPDSGPPEKILTYLEVLAELARRRRAGPLGEDLVIWLQKHGVSCSNESLTVNKSKAERKLRTWDDGAGADRYFELHLKPSEQTSPDRCVRIYCEYDEPTRKVIVGWVGRKPGL